MITEALGALSAIFGTLKPIVEDHVAQKYDKEHQDRLSRFNEIMALANSVDRASLLGGFTLQLCDKAGVADRGVSGTSIEVPVSDYVKLVECASRYINATEQLARISIK